MLMKVYVNNQDNSVTIKTYEVKYKTKILIDEITVNTIETNDIKKLKEIKS